MGKGEIPNLFLDTEEKKMEGKERGLGWGRGKRKRGENRKRRKIAHFY